MDAQHRLLVCDGRRTIVWPHVVVHPALGELVEPFVTSIRARYGQYRRGNFYDDCVGKICASIAEATAITWETALDEVEGIDSVPVLTIHKSKGLEYDAVFFVGLEDGAFWNFRKNRDEESNIFFVAVSRARKRVVFTFSQTRGRGRRKQIQSRSDINELYKLMEAAGVHFLKPVQPQTNSLL